VRRLSVNLATWARARKHHRLYRCITYWWSFRNWWLNDVWDRYLSRRWFRFTMLFRPTCAEGHNRVPLVSGVCPLCMLGDLRRQARVARLRPPR
jgi:hypothetical protein